MPVDYSADRPGSGLPAVNQAWPPPRCAPVYASMRDWSAWFSGDPDLLMDAYYSTGDNSQIGRRYFATTGEAGSNTWPGASRGGLLGSIRRWFWGAPTPQGERRTNYHVPIAGDIAATSAALLFSQPPTLRADQDGAAQDYLDGLIDDGTHSTLIEAAETCAALGGVFLRVVWDTDIPDRPWIDLVPPDAAVPEFKYGRLVAVTFWRPSRTPARKSSGTWRSTSRARTRSTTACTWAPRRTRAAGAA